MESKALSRPHLAISGRACESEQSSPLIREAKRSCSAERSCERAGDIRAGSARRAERNGDSDRAQDAGEPKDKTSLRAPAFGSDGRPERR